MTQADPPLFVDLDGTLVTTDTLLETAKLVAAQHKMAIPRLLLSGLRGRAYFKRTAAGIRLIDVTHLPYHPAFLAYLREAHQAGRRLILATGADRKIADAVAAHLGLFAAVMASDGATNLTGVRKLAAIRGHVGEGEFDYAGDSFVDMPIFLAARRCLLVKPSSELQRIAYMRCAVERVF